MQKNAGIQEYSADDLPAVWFEDQILDDTSLAQSLCWRNHSGSKRNAIPVCGEGSNRFDGPSAQGEVLATPD